MSIAGGLHLAIERGDELACEAIQIFTQSSRTWKSTPLTEEDISLFQIAKAKAKTVRSVVAHNSYLLNLSTADSAMRKKSVSYFIDNMNRCEALGIDGLITHPGSHLGAGMEEGVRLTAESIKEIQIACKGFKTKLLLENTAGQGGCVGCQFEEMASILDQTDDPDSIYFCFDTQHAFAAGYDLRTEESFDAAFKKWNKLIGVKKIVAFHLNDALKELGCRVDRHQNIGKGYLGKETFRILVNDKRFKKTPMCLETDPGENLKNYRAELTLLRKLRIN
jgi:deoxyribonuclease IV